MAALLPTGAAGTVWDRQRNTVLLAGACLLAVWCYAPALHAYFAQDDFTVLALVRLLHEPWQLFYHDHFPGSLFFRPLGIFVWWLAAAAFDNAPRGHYAVNLLLHLGVVLALYTLLQRLRRDAPLNVAWTAAYAVHPLAIGTALWLSDRFDLIATAFSLLALCAALDYTQRPRPGRLAAVVCCLLVAFMGKEIAIVAAIASIALIALPNRGRPLSLAQRWLAVGAIALTAAGWLAYRHAMLLEPNNALRYSGPLVAMFKKGTALWLRIGFEYLALDPRQTAWMAVLLALGAALLVAAIVLARRREGWRPGAFGVVAALLVLLLLPGPTQAPVVSVSTSDLTAQTFWFDLVGESRLYHMSLAALVACLMLLTTPDATATGAGRASRRAGVAAAGGLLLMLAAWVPASHALAHDFARRTREQLAPLQAAHAAIAQLPLPQHRCQIYLLAAQSIWGLQDIGDPTIKASSPAPAQKLDHCLVMTERTPWGNFVRSHSISAEDYRPLRALEHQGEPLPWLDVGGLQVAYLNLDSDIDARAIDGAFFLEYRNGAFVDVSEQVRSGTRPVQFFNARPAEK